MIRKLLKFISLIIGISLIFLYLYLRLRERLPRELTFPFSELYFIFSLCMLIIYIFSLKKLFKPSSNVFTKTLLIIIEHFYLSIKQVYEEIIFPLVKYILNNYMYLICYFFYPNVIDRERYVYFFFMLFPRIIISLAFCLDVIYFNYMYYLYKVIHLIWITIIYKIFLYIMKHWVKYFLNHMQEVFEIEETSEYFSFKQISNKVLFTEKEYDVYLNILVVNESGFSEKMEEIAQEIWVKYFYSFIYILYIITWGYTLIKIILNLL